LDTFGNCGLSWIFLDRLHRAGLLAFHALVAVVGDPAFEEAERRDEAEKSPERAEVAAPEARSKPVQGDDSSEDQECDGRHIVNRLNVVEVGKRYPSKEIEERPQYIEKKVNHRNDQGVKDKRIESSEKRHGIHKKGKGQPGNTGAEKDDKQDIFHFSKKGIMLQFTAALLGKEERIEEVDGDAHGTDITTEEPANDKCRSNKGQGPQRPGDDLTGSEDGVQSKKRIETQIDIRRNPVGQSVSGKDKKD
jgi:hypothetical protein